VQGVAFDYSQIIMKKTNHYGMMSGNWGGGGEGAESTFVSKTGIYAG
jgi:hypothetical protein